MAHYRLLNYNKNDTVATGLYGPKTTAILFDKLWIPSDFRHSQYGHDLGYDKIPLSVCVVEEIEESIKSFNSMGMIRNALLTGEYSVFPEPGVRRVRATIPAGQSQCSGRREPVSFPLLLCITTGCAEHGGQGCCAWPPCRLSAFSHEFASYALTNI